jgi:hypothetical protein
LQKKERDAEPTTLSQERNKELKDIRANEFPDLKDFYNEFDRLDVTDADKESYKKYLEGLDDDEKKMLKEKSNIYVVEFENVGGLVMPIIFDAEFEDGSMEHFIIPAEIWSKDNEKTSRMFITEKPLVSLTLDPKLETADVDLSNNFYPPKISKSRFELYKSKKEKNSMQKAGLGESAEDDADGEKEKARKKTTGKEKSAAKKKKEKSKADAEKEDK